MIIHDCAQGEGDWLRIRAGKVTASEFKHLMTPLFTPRKGEMPHTYLCKKAAELWQGEPLPEFNTFVTEQGKELEDEARRWFAFEHNRHRVTNVGFIEHDDGRCGCSPDALLDDDGGLEIKCPQPTNHFRYLIDDVLPDDYVTQVHFSLYVTGRKWWKFISYRRKAPKFVLTVERDEKICAAIGECLAAFYARLDDAMARLREADL